jgi:hypothetical protein
MFVILEALGAHLDSPAKQVPVEGMKYTICGLGVVGEAPLWKHRGLARGHQEFPSPEHSSIREGDPDEKALEQFFHNHNIQCEKQTTVNLLSRCRDGRQRYVSVSISSSRGRRYSS